MVLLGCTVKSLHFCNLFYWFKCYVDLSDYFKCVGVAKDKGTLQHSLFLGAILGVTTEKPRPSTSGQGPPLSYGNILEIIYIMIFDCCGT